MKTITNILIAIALVYGFSTIQAKAYFDKDNIVCSDELSDLIDLNRNHPIIILDNLDITLWKDRISLDYHIISREYKSRQLCVTGYAVQGVFDGNYFIKKIRENRR